MEKVMEESEIKGLEEEIDSAVDRLFVEKRGKPAESPLEKPRVKEPTFKMEKDVDLETSMGAPSPEPPKPSVKEPAFKMEKDVDLEPFVRAPSPEAPVPRSIEKMESQLLSLEWEITKENLAKTREEVVRLRDTMKEKADVTSVLGFMERTLNYMIKNEEKIRPPMVKFLLDSKETVRLLMKKEADNETNTYKQLSYAGIQARYACLEELKEARPERPAADSKEEMEKSEAVMKRDRQIEEIMHRMNLFLEKGEDLLKRFDQHLLRPDQGIQEVSGQLDKASSVSMDITVVKVGGKLFGVESDKVVKLFKVPQAFEQKYASQQKIRLKDFEIRLIDLRKIFSIPKGDAKEGLKILAVKDDGEYKGLMIDQVLERLSAQSDIGGSRAEYLVGKFRWTYQERPVEVPILDLARF